MSSSRPVAFSVLVALLVFPAGNNAFAKTINVGPASTYKTIQAAINAAVKGDVVVVAKGTYKENIDFKGKAITVQSTYQADASATAGTVIDGSKSGSVVTFKSGEKRTTLLRGFTITNGSGTVGRYGGITFGGGVICLDGSSPTLTDNTVSGNSASHGGGMACSDQSSPALTHNTIRENSGVYTGGGVYCYYSSPALSNNSISGNSAVHGGGVYCGWGASPALTNNTISGNSVSGYISYGAGVACFYASSPVLTNNTISGNSTSSSGGAGGGLACCYSSSPILTHNTFNSNFAHDSGGGAYCLGSWAILVNNTISNNSVSTFGGGGGVCCEGGSTTLTKNTISGNSAGMRGGGVSWYGSGSLNDNTIKGNSAGDGGGVCCGQASLIVAGNTISGNEGGGVRCYDNSSATISNNVISGNQDGGVYCEGSSPSLTNNTISGNSNGGTVSGGICCGSSSSPVIKNTIVAFNSCAGLKVLNADCTPVVTHCDFYGNTYYNTGSNFDGFADPTGSNGNISVNPLFYNVAAGNFHEKSKGGRWDRGTKTWVIDAVHSPCIDAGDPTSAFSKEPKPNGGRINMGAYGNTAYASKTAPVARGGSLLVTANANSTAGGVTQITVNVTSSATVHVSVLSLAGREVAVLPQRDLLQGMNTLLWNGMTSRGTTAPAGQYLVRVMANGQDGSRAQALACLSLRR
ncbi:MAG: right-handed parallel beta-helix repeat-containing protein [Armatimonadota bacterium]